MNNLKLYSEISLNLELRSVHETIVSFALDIERNRLFFASSSNLIYTTQLSSFQDGKAWSRSILSAVVRSVDVENADSITCFDYLMEKEALILGTANGMLLLHAVDDNSTEVVGRVDGGVKCISPSPGGDLLAIVTGFGQLLVMTHDWDLLYEVSLLDDQPDAYDVRELDLPSRNVLESSVSWRGDGKYLATLCDLGNSCSLYKRIKVWEQDSGALHAASDSKAFMGTVLEWMPSGAKIAAVYDRRSESECPAVAFYERNGLVRSSFSIGEPMDATVEYLKWNCSSDLLASVVRCHGYDCVKVWFFSNNRWYLKHEIRHSRHDGVRFMWDPIKPLQLFCWTLRGQITVYNFIWTTAVMDNSVALVIDGPNVLVTPLSLSVMPPPLYSFSLKFPGAVCDLAFHCKNTKNCLTAYLSDGCLCVAELPELVTWEELEGKEFNIEASISETVFKSFAHLTWLDSHVILAVSLYDSSHGDGFSHCSLSEDGPRGLYLQEIELVCSEGCLPGSVTGSGWHAKSSFKTYFEGQVISISHNPVKRYSAFVQFDGGKVLEYTSKLGLVDTGKHDDVGFSSSCPWMGVIAVSNNGLLRPLLFGFDVIGRLHIGGKTLCNNCRSFSFYSNLADQVMTHLILATKQDCLFIVDINDIQHGEVDLKYGNFVYSSNRREEQNMNFINIWERGAQIIGVLHGDDAGVIMQTNRGNLECLYPRKLVLASIVNALMQGRFRDAQLMVRRHRIDFNIIVDHCGWQAFLQSASEFVKQVNNLSYLTEFVCSIRNGNIMETLYKNYLPSTFQKVVEDVKAKELKSFDSSNKVSAVLLAVRKALEEQVPETPARELCILTTLAHCDPPALEEALERIKIIREMELTNSNDPRRISFPSAEEALKHLLWLSDSEAVFEAALGLYDLNLAAMVALNSQRDPKEFLPYLQELEHMPDLIMRYSIDLRLHRFEKALKHIISAGEAYYSDCMNLLNKNPQLFPLGLQLISDHTKRMQVLEAWGDHLSEEKCFEDAATTYLCCSSSEKALKAYRACGNWGGVLTVAGLLKFGKDEIIQLAYDLCEELQALGKPGEAAKIALEYCGDVNGGINLLVSAREWEEALRVAYVHMRDDLILEVRNASLECASTLISEFEESLEKVGKYLTRYLAVRQRRLLLAAKLQSEDVSMNDLDEDTASEASSRFSGMSAYTRGTRPGSAASVSPSVTSKGRDVRRQKSRGKIRPGRY
uniref:Elongator complex protein 1 n=1 Tax=Rhizophora mucronata TaxID=61149 RepID=A0A2P2JV20_RHIMU